MAESLHLVIIGAGLCGLGAAIATKVANPEHRVTILESVKELAEIGAGLQLTPNSTRLFKVWGIYDELVSKATFPKSLSVYRYDGTKLLAHEPHFQDQMDQRYGSPFWGMHRVDLQRAMVRRAKELGVVVQLAAKVTWVDFSTSPSVTLESGTVISGDVVLCADGLWSSTRSQFLGRPSPATLTGDLAYRIVIKTADLHGPDAAELKAFIDATTVSFWAGAGTHVVAYTMRAGSLFNIVLLCPDDLPASVTKTAGDLDEMKRRFDGWDPVLRRFLDQVGAVAKWKLMWLDPPLPVWANPSGSFLMAGDACHPMLPYLAQGANSSLEDAAVLGSLLAHVAHATRAVQLPRVARLYQDLRKARGDGIARETFAQRHDFHLPDGPEQQARDARMLAMLGGDLQPDFPSRWTCPRVQPWLYGYDAYEEAEEAYRKNPF